jgi:mRNA interferase YafQ
VKLFYTVQFKKDYKRIKKQKKDIGKLRSVIEQLTEGRKLSDNHRDHPLSGQWAGHRDCHIEFDWILIYKITSDSVVLERTGSHAELF